MSDEYVTAKEIAEMLNVTVQWVRDHTTRAYPILPHYKMGRYCRYVPTEVREKLRSCRQDKPTWERN